LLPYLLVNPAIKISQFNFMCICLPRNVNLCFPTNVRIYFHRDIHMHLLACSCEQANFPYSYPSISLFICICISTIICISLPIHLVPFIFFRIHMHLFACSLHQFPIFISIYFPTIRMHLYFNNHTYIFPYAYTPSPIYIFPYSFPGIPTISFQPKLFSHICIYFTFHMHLYFPSHILTTISICTDFLFICIYPLLFIMMHM